MIMATGKMWVLTGLIAAFLAVAGLYSNSDSHSHLEAGKMGTDPILQKLGTDPILQKMGTDPILGGVI